MAPNRPLDNSDETDPFVISSISYINFTMSFSDQPDFVPVVPEQVPDLNEYLGVHAENIADRLLDKLEEIEKREAALESRIREFGLAQKVISRQAKKEPHPAADAESNSKRLKPSGAHLHSAHGQSGIPAPHHPMSSERTQPTDPALQVAAENSLAIQSDFGQNPLDDQELLAKATSIRLRAQRFHRFQSEIVALFSEVVEQHGEIRGLIESARTGDPNLRNQVLQIAPSIEELTARLADFSKSKMMQRETQDARAV